MNDEKDTLRQARDAARAKMQALEEKLTPLQAEIDEFEERVEAMQAEITKIVCEWDYKGVRSEAEQLKRQIEIEDEKVCQSEGRLAELEERKPFWHTD